MCLLDEPCPHSPPPSKRQELLLFSDKADQLLFWFLGPALPLQGLAPGRLCSAVGRHCSAFTSDGYKPSYLVPEEGGGVGRSAWVLHMPCPAPFVLSLRPPTRLLRARGARALPAVCLTPSALLFETRVLSHYTAP